MRTLLWILIMGCGSTTATGAAPVSKTEPPADTGTESGSEAGPGTEAIAGADPETQTECAADAPSCLFPDDGPAGAPPPADRSVLGAPLAPCSMDPLTGWRRSGSCSTGPSDRGIHVVCAEMTPEFLRFTAARGTALSTPMPAFRFPGLNPGDRWCLCASRWQEAYDAGVAPGVVLEATEERALDLITDAALRSRAVE